MGLFFEDKHLERVKYNNSLSLKTYFKNAACDENTEYVVVWYQSKFRLADEDNSKVLVPVSLLDISHESSFKYNKESKRFEDTSDSLIELLIPINFLHKLPIGSIWKDGKSKQRFELPIFELTIKPVGEDGLTSNFKTYTFYQANTAYNKLHIATLTPQQRIEVQAEAKKYPRLFELTEYLPTLKHDANELINVTQDNRIFTIHPVSLLVAHYGYSMELKRIFAAYSWGEVLNILGTNNVIDVDLDRYVPIPIRLTLRDAIILNEIKYNTHTREVVTELVNSINLNRGKQARPFERVPVGFWHNQEIKMLIRGIPFRNGNVLCASIDGITEPQGEAINAVLKNDYTSAEANLTQDEIDAIKSQPKIIEKVIPPENIEVLDIVRNPVNTLAVTALTQRFLILGQKRQINKSKSQKVNGNPNSNDSKLVIFPEPENYSVGEKRGANDKTGLVNCLLDTEVEERSQLDRLWYYGNEISGAKCSWFTYNLSFQNSDNFHVMSLNELHKVNVLPTNRPKIVFLMRVIYDFQTYYILDFGKGYRGIGYKAEPNEDFVGDDGNFIKILGQVVLSNGTVDIDYPANFKNRLVLFKHSTNKTNAQEQSRINWARKVIRDLN